MQRHWLTLMAGSALVMSMAATTHAQESDESDFAFWDTDASGDISREEWDGGIANIRTGMQAEDGGNEDDRALYNTYRDYNEVDLNDDERIDSDEFERFQDSLENQ
ncbi:hypothetical protein [Modicisalibacter xianhensis]|uniref:EF hand n=1 Tax=Modicisalibacter xianhensis TaxID=442341 RepID=A0A1I3F1F6_9GAMM|nr:hypothetical protein [Halomonas xianhensis]SFI04611.1 hypothetical protein SAMN04487959_11597 [Halomonas xianhensis]